LHAGALSDGRRCDFDEGAARDDPRAMPPPDNRDAAARAGVSVDTPIGVVYRSMLILLDRIIH